MSVRMKKPPTNRVELRFIGPVEHRDEVIEAAKSFGYIEESFPWRACFPEASKENLPWIALSGARTKEGLTQREVSVITGIPQRHISEMENGKRTIGKERAKKLAEALKVNYKVFL